MCVHRGRGSKGVMCGQGLQVRAWIMEVIPGKGVQERIPSK